MKYKVLLRIGKWARYINKDNQLKCLSLRKPIEYLLNRLTPLYSKIHYKERTI